MHLDRRFVHSVVQQTYVFLEFGFPPSVGVVKVRIQELSKVRATQRDVAGYWHFSTKLRPCCRLSPSPVATDNDKKILIHTPLFLLAAVTSFHRFAASNHLIETTISSDKESSEKKTLYSLLLI